MFLVQPMFAKMALPRLGGTAAVWSLALVFFQAVLLLGYGYAHLLSKLASLRQAVTIHATVMVLSMVSLPLGISEAWREPPETGQALWLMGLFTASIGLPFFAISANAPLLQSWFARSGHAQAQDPYFLYGASNAGSFVALFAYPLLVEPFLGLVPQSHAWSLGYVLLVGLVVTSGLMAAMGLPAMAASTVGAPAAGSPTWQARLKWIALAFVPSGLLVGVTAHIATDLVSAPFMWVIPLALFLLTFVITFQSKPVIPHAFVLRWLGLLVAPACLFTLSPATNLWLLPLHLGVVFAITMACHGELARLRPPVGQLTEFYFLMSLGGVLGGLFASLLSPLIFDRVLEYPLLIVAGFLVVGMVRTGATLSRSEGLVILAVMPAAFLLSFMAQDLAPETKQLLLLGWVLAALVGLLVFNTRTIAQAAILATVLLSYQTVSHVPSPIVQSRSFYGVLAVYAMDGGRIHMLSHGTTKHGSQVVKDANGLRLTTNPEPQSYYYAGGPFGSLIRHLRSDGRPLRNVAVIGLGTGALACHALPGESWDFFEIDPEVVRIARDPSYFTYMRDCGPRSRVVLGDGRLKLEAEPAGSYDLIVLDAFSSDSVPAHLMTLEALDIYLSRLKPDGVLVYHISNRFMELSGVVEAAARARGLQAFYNALDNRFWNPDRRRLDLRPHLAVVAKSPHALSSLSADPAWHRAPPEDLPAPWTDDYSNVLGAIIRKLTGTRPF